MNLDRCTTELKKKPENDDFRLDELEQYDRRQNLELGRVPYKEDENITQTVIDLAASLDVDVKEEEISIAHRLQLRRGGPYTRGKSNRTKKHPTIIFLFDNRFKKTHLYTNRLNAKDIKKFPVNKMTHFYTDKNLTQKRKRLFWLTKLKARELNYKYIWASNS